MIKQVRTPEYNCDFDTKTGKFKRWGASRDTCDDPQYSPIGPELVDMEISTICHGISGVPCKHCYKSNTAQGKNMSFETFGRIFDKLPGNVGQIAFGIGDLDSNPDMLEIFGYCKTGGVIPNVTTNGWKLDDWWAEELASVCGAVAVSRYYDKNICYDAVEKLTKAGLKQVNIHQLVSEETYENCVETINDIINNEPRLDGLNAIVFLSLKKKGRGEGYHRLSEEKFDNLVKLCLDNWVRFGFDSCTAHRFTEFIELHPKYHSLKNQLRDMIEPCESTLFSIYINVDGEVFPCSFCEGEGWGSLCPSTGKIGIPVLKCDDFLQDIWYSNSIKRFRKDLIDNCRKCPMFEV